MSGWVSCLGLSQLEGVWFRVLGVGLLKCPFFLPGFPVVVYPSLLDERSLPLFLRRMLDSMLWFGGPPLLMKEWEILENP